MQANCGEYFLKERLVGTIMTVYIGGDNYQSLDKDAADYVPHQKKCTDVVFCDDYDNSWYTLTFSDGSECRMCP
jgi:hypothetical protein